MVETGQVERNGAVTKAARARLILAVTAFTLWLGWLAYLAFTTIQPTVLSRPQFLVSTFDVLAEVGAKEGRRDHQVTIKKVYWPIEEAGKHVDERVTIADLPELEKDGWAGPGLYLLPLTKQGDHYRVAAIPPSPGYLDIQHRIYQITDRNRHQVEHQLKEIRKPAEQPG